MGDEERKRKSIKERERTREEHTRRKKIDRV